MFVAAAYQAVWDRLPVRRRGKSGRSADVLTMTPSPWVFRRTGRNRFGHELARTPVANPRRRRLPRLRPDLPSSLLTPRTGRRPQARPVRRRTVCDDGVAGAQRLFAPRHATVGKRFGSVPIGGGGDSPLTHRPPGYRHDVHGRADQSAAAVWISTRADEPFFRGDEPERSSSPHHRHFAKVRR